MIKPGTKISFFLEDEHETFVLGRCLAEVFNRLETYPALLFTGAPGTGKTTMIRGIVRTLPGGADAEISSPSFNILNIYPTRPETAHFDLYRLEDAGLDPESEEVLLDREKFIFVEWSEFLPSELRPADAILISLELQVRGRAVEMIIKDRTVEDMLLKSKCPGLKTGLADG